MGLILVRLTIQILPEFHRRFVQMLQYKEQIAGIKVVLVEESYTSKC